MERQVSAEKTRLNALVADTSLSNEQRAFVQERIHTIENIEAEITKVQGG